MEEAYGWLIPTSVFLLLFVFLSKFILHRHAKHTNLPPSPPALPLIGHLHLIKQPLHRSFHKLTEKNGHMVFLQLGTRKVLVVSSPSAVKECFTKHDATFANRPQYTIAGKHFNYDNKTIGFASYGEHWRNLKRRTTLELFSTNRVAMFAAVREKEVQLLVKQLFEECRVQKSKVELRPRFVELAFNIMLRMISGKRYFVKHAVAQEGKEFQILMKELTELQGSGILIDFFPILQWVDLTRRRKEDGEVDEEGGQLPAETH